MDYSVISVNIPNHESYKIDRVFSIETTGDEVHIRQYNEQYDETLRIIPNNMLDYLTIEYLGKDTKLLGDHSKIRRKCPCGKIFHDELIEEMFSVG